MGRSPVADETTILNFRHLLEEQELCGQMLDTVNLEWPFRIIKRVFGFTKVRYRGLKKNHEWLCAAFALVNIYQHRCRLAKVSLQMAPQGA